MVMWSLWVTGRDDGEFELVKKCLRAIARTGMLEAGALDFVG